MTTKCLDNKICTFKMLLSWRFPRKAAFLDDFPLCPRGPPPSKVQTFYLFIVVSPSLSLGVSESFRGYFQGVLWVCPLDLSTFQ